MKSLNVAKFLSLLILFLLFVLFMLWYFAWFKQDRAAYYTQKQEWEKAEEILQPSLTKNPRTAKTLYGLGVSSYKRKEYDRAGAYFASALEYETDIQKKEELFFNYGNALAFQKKLHEAVEAYEKALEINPDNEHVKHNLEIVKKMLENQEQQQHNDQQKQQENQDKNNEQQQDNQNNQNNQDNKDNSDQNENSDGQQEQNRDQNEQQHDGDSEQDKQQKDERENGGSENKSNQDKQSQDKSGEDSRDEPQQKDSNNKRDNERGDHDESPKDSDDQNDSSENDTQEQEKEQEAKPESMYGGVDDSFKELDAHLARMLDAQEKKDADLSKQIIKMQVDKQLAGQDGQNRW